MSDVIQITSRANPTFQRLRRLATEPRERTRSNRTLLEGDHLIGTWLERDHAVAALIDDIESRGLRDKILLVCCGEMGRTPVINPPRRTVAGHSIRAHAEAIRTRWPAVRK